MAEQPHLSFSQLNTYSSCAYKFKLMYIDRVPREPQGSWLGGKSVHGAIEDAETLELWQPTGEVDESLSDTGTAQVVRYFGKRFERAVEEAGGPDAVRWGGSGGTEHYLWWQKNGPQMCRRYVIARRALDASGWVGVATGIEVRLEAEIGGRNVLGYIDRYLMREVNPETGETDEPTVIDWYTGRIGGKDPRQFATYAGLLERHKGIVTTRGIAVYLRTADPDKQIQVVNFAGLVPMLDQIYGDLVRGIDEGFFPTKPSDYCFSCSVRAYCEEFQAVNGE